MEITARARSEIRRRYEKYAVGWELAVHVDYSEEIKDLIRDHETGKGKWVVVIPEGYRVSIKVISTRDGEYDCSDLLSHFGSLVFFEDLKILDGTRIGLNELDYCADNWIVNGENAVEYSVPEFF